MNINSILLVEKDQNLRQSIALILQRTGYHVTGIDCMEKLEDLLCSRVFNLLILDLDKADFKQLVHPLDGNKYPGLPILILTGQSISRKDKEDGLPRGEYLVKPIAPETLLDRVEKIIKKEHPHPGKNINYMNSPAV